VLFCCEQDGEIAEPFWRILEYFDPDRLGYFLATLQGLRRFAPDRFERWLHGAAERWAAQSDSTTYDEARDQLLRSDHILTSPLRNWEPPVELKELVRRRLAPLDAENPFDRAWKEDARPDNAMMQVSTIRELGEEPVFSLRAREIDPRVDLMLVDRIGSVSPGHEGTLAERGVAVAHREAEMAHLGHVLDICWSKDVSNRLALDAAFRAASGEQTGPAWSDSHLNRTPFALAETACGWYTLGAHRRRRDSLVVVAGDTAADYCFAMGLNRLFKRALWMPLEFLSSSDVLPGEVRSHLAHFLDQVSGYGYGGGDVESIEMTSLSIDVAGLEPAIQELSSIALGDSLSSRISLIDPDAVTFHRPMRLLNNDQLFRDRYEPFVEGQMAGVLDTPRPEGVTETIPMEFTWHMDALIDQVRLPPRSCLNEAMHVASELTRRSVRASSEGISYHSREEFFFPAGASVEQMTFHPRLRLPDAQDLFQRLFADAGLRAAISQAGRYSTGAIELWGGLGDIAGDFRDPARNALLQAFRSKERSGVAPGVYLDVKRRFLSIWDVRRVTKLSTEAARDLIDSYVARGILARGLCLKCSRCSYAGWYSLDEIGQTFRCGRCRHEGPISGPVWRKPQGQPLFFYQLDELAYQAIDHDARAPLLTLDQLQTESRDGFLFAPEMEIFEDDKRLAEIDILAIYGAAIVIGEAKTTDMLHPDAREEERALKKLGKVSKRVGAHEVALATTELNWSERTVEAARRILDEVGMRHRSLTNLGSPR